MLENIEPAPPVIKKTRIRPAVEFDGQEGEATTPGYDSEPENFDDFLIDAGFNPDDIEVIPPMRTSRWQQQKDGELVWLTSYRFRFRKKRTVVDLPLLMAEAEKRVKKTKPKTETAEKALIVAWSDLQVGKVDHRGGTENLIRRIAEVQDSLEELVKREKPERLLFIDVGDTVENFDNTNREQQAVTNDLSIMEQVDLATTMAWRVIRSLAEQIPTVTYASVGSNHCQWRRNGKTIGKPTDDWGVFIGRQLARLAGETGHENIRFLEPQPHDESLAVDVFEDGYHVVGCVHGHQATRPNLLEDWWKKQMFGHQPVKDATILLHGHFHHLRLTELGYNTDGVPRFLIGAPTLDNGSNWYKLRAGADSLPGLLVFALAKETPFDGAIRKL